MRPWSDHLAHQTPKTSQLTAVPELGGTHELLLACWARTKDAPIKTDAIHFLILSFRRRERPIQSPPLSSKHFSSESTQ
jgi:hypothetical protein